MSEYDGSTNHPDPAREEFVQQLASGEALYAAYHAAGTKSPSGEPFKHPRGNAQRMLREPEVAARLKWLMDRVAALGLDETLIAYRREQHRRALEHIAEADRLELFEEKTVNLVIGKDLEGNPLRRRVKRLSLKPLAQLTDEQRALIDGVEITNGGGIKVTIPKRLDARTMLAKLDGFDKPVKIAPTDPSGDYPAHYLISERPMTEAEWEAQRAGVD
jgi:hypothetical protein